MIAKNLYYKIKVLSLGGSRMINLEQLERIYRLDKEHPNEPHTIGGAVAAFILDNELADDIKVKWENDKMTMNIVYKGVTFVWETRTKPWNEIKKKFVN